MKQPVALFSIVAALVVAATALLSAQGGTVQPSILVPSTSIESTSDIGLRAHTNHLILLGAKPNASGVSPNVTPAGESPATIRPVYKLPSTGGSGTIAIVDAFHDPTAASDLAVFSNQFGLRPCTVANGCFKVIFAKGTKPAVSCGWAQEISLDVQWAHAMAPNAKIVLVEAATNSFADLFQAVDVATSQVTTGGGKGEISMSWSGSEFSTESSFDPHFQNANAVYFAAAGDVGGVNGYPSVSPFVTSAGGTTIHRNGSGQFTSETAWSGSGGGPSKFELKPSYQNGVAGTSTTKRSAPDLAFDADPNSGVAVFDSTSCNGLQGWLVFGGTSVASPALAGIVNLAGHSNSTTAELTTIYANRNNAADFRDILTGRAGSFQAKKGYDFITGVGSPLTLNGK